MGIRAAVGACVSVLALAASACGGRGRLTKAQTITRADAICDRDAQSIAAANRLPAQPTAQQVAAFSLATVVPAYRREVAGLRALKPPAADAARVAKVWDELEQSVDVLESDARSDPAKLLGAPPAVIAQAGKGAQAYGFTRCARARHDEHRPTPKGSRK